MKIRISIPIVLLLTLVCLLAAAILLDSPRALYTRMAVSAYNAALSNWQSSGPDAYTIVVASNSLTHPTGGLNTIDVQGGLVLEGRNPACEDCPPEAFEPLTVEGLFRRIEAECLVDFPSQFCNVAYHDTIGYPVRLDTYPYHLSGIERPSITIQSLQPLQP